jgi:hypothetical protein
LTQAIEDTVVIRKRGYKGIRLECTEGANAAGPMLESRQQLMCGGDLGYQLGSIPAIATSLGPCSCASGCKY